MPRQRFKALFVHCFNVAVAPHYIGIAVVGKVKAFVGQKDLGKGVFRHGHSIGGPGAEDLHTALHIGTGEMLDRTGSIENAFQIGQTAADLLCRKAGTADGGLKCDPKSVDSTVFQRDFTVENAAVCQNGFFAGDIGVKAGNKNLAKSKLTT